VRSTVPVGGCRSVLALAMNGPPPIPPIISPHRVICYELTRWDLFANWMTVIIRNRILQIFVLVALILNGLLILGPGLATRPFFRTVFDGAVYLVGFLGFLAAVQCILALANAFLLKQRGVVGRHALEITEQGLIERTDCNETLHRWPSICRILSLGGYLYIYVSDNNSHQVPKRCFSPQEIDSLLVDLRQHAKQ
jgi:hypothetical protein